MSWSEIEDGRERSILTSDRQPILSVFVEPEPIFEGAKATCQRHRKGRLFILIEEVDGGDQAPVDPASKAAPVTVERLDPAWQACTWPAGVALYMEALRKAGLPAPEFAYEEIPQPDPADPDKDRTLLRFTLAEVDEP